MIWSYTKLSRSVYWSRSILKKVILIGMSRSQSKVFPLRISTGSVPVDSNMPVKQAKHISSLTFYVVFRFLSHFSMRVACCHGESRGFGPRDENFFLSRVIMVKISAGHRTLSDKNLRMSVSGTPLSVIMSNNVFIDMF